MFSPIWGVRADLLDTGEFGPGGAGMTRSLGENPSLTGPGSEGHEWRE